MTGEKGQLLHELAARFNALPPPPGEPAARVELQFIGSYEEGLSKSAPRCWPGRARTWCRSMTSIPSS